MSLSFGFALPNAGNNFRGDIFSQLLPADQRVEAASGTQEVANGCLDNRVVELRAIVPEVTNANLLFNSSMAGATGSVLPTNWASGSVSGLTYTISSASTVQGFPSIEWSVSGTAAQDGDLWLACEPMQSGSVVAQIPSEYVGSMYCAKVSGTISSGMALQLLTQNFSDGAVQESNTKDLAAVTGSTFVRIEPNSLKTDIDLENRVNLRLYQTISSGDVVDFTIRVAAPQVEAGFVASPFISTVSGAVSEVRGRPSILVVPQLTKSGVVYPQLPTVSGADFTFTRATTATRVNASGLIESVASGLLRLDYPIGGGCPAALIEPSGTNLIKQSEAFNTAEWTGFGLNAFGSGSVANSTGTTDPFGGTNADYIQENSASGTHIILQINAGQVSGTNLTFSVFAKAAERTQINLFNNGGGGGNATFNLTSGTATLVAGVSASIQNYGNGWYRCILTYTPNATGNFNVQVRLVDASGNTSYTGTGASGLYVFGAQMETGAIPTSYIPTTTASATRNADVCSVSGVSGYIGQTEGTIYVEFAYFGQPVIRSGPVYLRQASGRGLSINSAVSEGIVFISRNNGGETSLTLVSGALQIGTFYKVAIAYDAAGTAAGGSQTSGVVAYVNGVQTAIGTFRVPDAAGLTEFRMYGANAGTDAEAFNGRIRAAAIYTTRLDNATLANLTRLT